jgi:hypothetical protein
MGKAAGPDVDGDQGVRPNPAKPAKRATAGTPQDASPLLAALLAVPPPPNAMNVQPQPAISIDDARAGNSSQTPVAEIQSDGNTTGSTVATTSLLRQSFAVADPAAVVLPESAEARSSFAGDPGAGDPPMNPPPVQAAETSEQPQKKSPVDQSRISSTAVSPRTKLASDEAQGVTTSTFSPEGAVFPGSANSVLMDGASIAHSGPDSAGNSVADLGPVAVQVASSPAETAAATSFLRQTAGGAEAHTVAGRGTIASGKDVHKPAVEESRNSERGQNAELRSALARLAHIDTKDSADADPHEAAGGSPGSSAFTTSSAGAQPSGAAGTVLQLGVHSTGADKSTSAHTESAQQRSSLAPASDFDNLQPSPLSSLQSAQLLRRLEHAEIRIGVNSDNFGPVRLQTSLEADRVAALVETAHPALRAALLTEAGTLEKAMAQHRLQLQTFHVGGGQAHCNSGGFADHRHEPQPRNSAVPQWPLPSQTAAQPPLATAATSANHYRLDVQA